MSKALMPILCLLLVATGSGTAEVIDASGVKQSVPQMVTTWQTNSGLTIQLTAPGPLFLDQALLTVSMREPTRPSFRQITFGIGLKKQLTRCRRDRFGFFDKSKQKVPCWDGPATDGKWQVYVPDVPGTLLPLDHWIVIGEHDGGVSMIHTELYYDAVSYIEELFTQRYGKPVHTATRPMLTSFGTEVAQTQTVWRTDDLMIRMFAPWPEPRRALVEVFTRAEWERLTIAGQAQRQQALDALK